MIDRITHQGSREQLSQGLKDYTPQWAKDQIGEGLVIGSRTTTQVAINALSRETLIDFFTKNVKTVFSKKPPTGPENSAAHILMYQKALNILKIPVDMDGLYGSNTTSAIAKFQTSKKIKSDGIPGPITTDAILGALKALQPTPVSTAEVITEVPTPLEKAQSYLLNEWKFTDNHDGTYTSATNDFTIAIVGNTAHRVTGGGNKLDQWTDKEKLILGEVRLCLLGKK